MHRYTAVERAHDLTDGVGGDAGVERILGHKEVRDGGNSYPSRS